MDDKEGKHPDRHVFGRQGWHVLGKIVPFLTDAATEALLDTNYCITKISFIIPFSLLVF